MGGSGPHPGVQRIRERKHLECSFTGKQEEKEEEEEERARKRAVGGGGRMGKEESG